MKTFAITLLFLITFQLGFSQKGKTSAAEPETYTGTFESKRGVMHHLSCHCYDGGYLTLEDGTEIAVCFEKNELEAVQSHFEKKVCTKMEVTGEMVEDVIKPAKGDVCMAGKITYLKVTSFTCLE